MENSILTEKELLEIKGGFGVIGSEFEKRNVNRTGTCICTFDNYSTIKNINKVTGCICWCD